MNRIFPVSGLLFFKPPVCLSANCICKCVRVCVSVLVVLNVWVVLCPITNYPMHFAAAEPLLQLLPPSARFPQLIDIILNSFTLINDIIPKPGQQWMLASEGDNWGGGTGRHNKQSAIYEKERAANSWRRTRTLRLIRGNFTNAQRGLLTLLNGQAEVDRHRHICIQSGPK